MTSSLRHLRGSFLVLYVLLCLPLASVAQQEANNDKPGCSSPHIVARTDRPTYSNGTDTTQCGVLEILGGIDRQWTGHDIHQDDLAQGFQFGLTPSLDLHYFGNTFLKVGGRPGPLSGISDSYVGVRDRLSRQTHLIPSLGAFYTIKVPTASPVFGISTGRFDHTLSILISKDLPKIHLDFNVSPQVIGRPASSGWDHNEALVFFGSVPLSKKITLVGGSYGFTKLNFSSPAYGVSSAGFDWQVSERLIVDLSMDEGLTSAAPRKRVGFGFTYAPANMYSLLTRTHSSIH